MSSNNIGQQHHPDKAEKLGQASENPEECKARLEAMEIDDIAHIKAITERTPCPKCNKSRKYFCYKCYVVVTSLQNRVPQVQVSPHFTGNQNT